MNNQRGHRLVTMVLALAMGIVLLTLLVEAADSTNYRSVTGNSVFPDTGVHGTGAFTSQDDSNGLWGGFSTSSSLSQHGGYGALLGGQPSGTFFLMSLLGNTTYSNTFVSANVSASDADYNIVSFNFSNSDSMASWGNVSNPSKAISGRTQAWTLQAGIDNEVRTVNGWVMDQIGLVGPLGSNTIVLDVTPPVIPQVEDVSANGSNQISIATTTNYYMSWGDATDNLSGVYNYEVRLVTANGVAVDWIDEGLSTRNIQPNPGPILMVNTVYFGVVRARDSAGNYSAPLSSSGIIVGTPNIQLTTTVVNKGRNATQSKSGATAIPNDLLEYTITFTNTGHYDAHQVNVYDMVPSGSIFFDGSAAFHYPDGTVTVYYLTSYSNLTGVTTEPADKTTIKGIRFNIPIVPIGSSGSLTFRVRVR